MENVVEKIAALSLAVVMAAAASGSVEKLQSWIWKQEAKLVNESRTATWGQPAILRGGPSRISKADSTEQVGIERAGLAHNSVREAIKILVLSDRLRISVCISPKINSLDLSVGEFYFSRSYESTRAHCGARIF